jgi:hypothetical protein
MDDILSLHEDKKHGDSFPTQKKTPFKEGLLFFQKQKTIPNPSPGIDEISKNSF